MKILQGNIMGKQIDRICNNCKIYDTGKGECSIVVLYEGQRLRVPMEPQDTCMYEQEYFDPTTKAMENFSEEIKEVKFWVENEKGEKVSGDGIVKMEYPAHGFFGQNLDEILSENE